MLLSLWYAECATHNLKNNTLVLTVISRFVLLVVGYNVLIINFDAIIVQNNQCLERGKTVCAVWLLRQ